METNERLNHRTINYCSVELSESIKSKQQKCLSVSLFAFYIFVTMSSGSDV